jgi:hypothetical protein
MMPKHEIDSVEWMLDPKNLTVTLSVSVVASLCAAAREAHAAVDAALARILEIGDPLAHQSWATIDGIGGLLRDRKHNHTQMYEELYGPNGAKKRAEDAEAAARVAWRTVRALEVEFEKLKTERADG